MEYYLGTMMERCHVPHPGNVQLVIFFKDNF
jgi:hypothetical protein